MKKNFYHRLIIVILLALGFVVLIASVALLPSFIISSSKESLTNEVSDINKTEELDEINQQKISAVSTLDSQLSLLEKTIPNTFSVSEKVINEILLKKSSSIKITQIFFEDNDVSGKTINIRGIAPNREILSLFHRALKDNPLFKKVDLPISNFVKGSNIQFYLSLIPYEN